MSDQSVRQTARRAALQAHKSRRGEQRALDKQLDAWAVDVCVALAQRDAWVTECEKRAGQALVAMTGAGGLSLREAVHRCGQGLTVRDATRLRRLCPAAAPDPEQEVDSGVAGQPVDQVSTVDHASTVDEPTAGDHT